MNTRIRLDEADLRYMAHHVLVNERHRLVLFTIPKVCCTQLIKLMRRMNGSTNWRDNPHYTSDRPFLNKLGLERVEKIVNDSSWTKALLLRDPAERLLSAYLDKLIYNGGYAANVFRAGGRGMPFTEFLGYILESNDDPRKPTGLHENTDPHWRSQHLVGPLEKVASALDPVGDYLDRVSWIHNVLHAANCWQPYGISGWGADENQVIFEQNMLPTRTNAAEQMSEYYDPDTLDAVYQAYAGDIAFAKQWGIDLVKHANLFT